MAKPQSGPIIYDTQIEYDLALKEVGLRTEFTMVAAHELYGDHILQHIVYEHTENGTILNAWRSTNGPNYEIDVFDSAGALIYSNTGMATAEWACRLYRAHLDEEATG